MPEYLKKAQERPAEDRRALYDRVETILNSVRTQGDAALRRYAKELDKVDIHDLRVSPAEIEAAERELPAELKAALLDVVEHVRRFAQLQRAALHDVEQEMYPGLYLGHRFVPVDSVGAYVPAGRYPTLSAAMMSIVPAKVAGVGRVIVASPPSYNGHVHPAILFGMHASGADEIYAMGGAQAIGAMAYGTETIKPVDMIVGPGNQYVAEAKRQLFGLVGIDLIAGPSEVMVIADDSARADWVAADLLAQCEHDPQARAALITTSGSMAESVLAEIEAQLKTLTTAKVAGQAWHDNGDVMLVSTLEEAAQAANAWAPEHLEVHTRDPKRMTPLLRNYGSLFVGEEAAEVFADKLAGMNHILPTLRGARYTGGLSVSKFLKLLTHQWCTVEAMKSLAPKIVLQSTFEGMAAHAAAAAIRLTPQ